MLLHFLNVAIVGVVGVVVAVVAAVPGSLGNKIFISTTSVILNILYTYKYACMYVWQYTWVCKIMCRYKYIHSFKPSDAYHLGWCVCVCFWLLEIIVSFVILLNTHRMNLLRAMSNGHYNKDFMADKKIKGLYFSTQDNRQPIPLLFDCTNALIQIYIHTHIIYHNPASQQGRQSHKGESLAITCVSLWLIGKSSKRRCGGGG